MKSLWPVNLHNAVTISQRRPGKRVARLDSLRMSEILTACAFRLAAMPVNKNETAQSQFRIAPGDLTLRYDIAQPRDWRRAKAGMIAD
jgi:hypothetical protein